MIAPNQSNTSILLTLFHWCLLNCIHIRTSFFTADGKCTNATGLQLPGLLDELFSYNGPLGALFFEESVLLCLWAPTAQVNIFLNQNSNSLVSPLLFSKLLNIFLN